MGLVPEVPELCTVRYSTYSALRLILKKNLLLKRSCRSC